MQAMPRRLLLLTIVLLCAALPFQGSAGVTHARTCAHAAQPVASDDTVSDMHAQHLQHGDHAMMDMTMTVADAPSACDCGCDCAGACGGLGTMAFSLPVNTESSSPHAGFTARAPHISHASVHPALPLRPPISA